MTTAVITDISEDKLPSAKYKAKELLKILLKNLEYDVELENFSQEENKELLVSSKYEEISSLID